jgi:hypothetical protein
MPKWYGLQGLIIIIISKPAVAAALSITPLQCFCAAGLRPQQHQGCRHQLMN